MAKAASGSGSIRKHTVMRKGKPYIYWEARYTSGYDPGTGKQIQKSVSGKTQKEVRQKLAAAVAAIDAGDFSAPSKVTVGRWAATWVTDYTANVKPLTLEAYDGIVNHYIIPQLGAVRLDSLTTHQIQTMYNGLKETRSAKTIRNIHGVLHKVLQQAVTLGMIRSNPSDDCVLAKPEDPKIRPLDDLQIGQFLEAIQGHRYENLYTVILFLGLREGEALGLMWDCVDWISGTVTIDKQLQAESNQLVSTKNGKSRTIAASRIVLEALEAEKDQQDRIRKICGDTWEDTGLCFTQLNGQHLGRKSVYDDYKKVVAQIGRPDARLHDLRHSYAVASLRAGDDIKTVQENLGHATASFTLDVYGHVTDQMKRASASRMDRYVNAIRENKGKTDL